MKRTTITMDGYGRVAVPSDATNVWMSEMECNLTMLKSV